MKVITLCGSYKFKNEMAKVAEELTLQGICVLTPIDLTRSRKDVYTAEEISTLKAMHKEKIRLSDAIFVVDEMATLEIALRARLNMRGRWGRTYCFTIVS